VYRSPLDISTFREAKQAKIRKPNSKRGTTHLSHGKKKWFCYEKKLGTTNTLFVAAATKRFVGRTKHFVVVTKYF